MRQLNKWFCAIVVGISMLNTGCIDEIRLDVEGAQQYLIVDGLLTDSLQLHTIKVKQSALIGSVSTDNIQPPVIGAQVFIKDDQGESFQFFETGDGVYTREMRGTPGRTYHVEILIPDGRKIVSKPAILQEAPQLSPATAKVIEELTVNENGNAVYKHKLALEMNTDVSGLAEPPYLRWRATGEYEFGEDFPGIIGRKICYIKQNVDFNNIKIFDANTLENGLLEDEPFLTTNYDYRYAYMYCFHLYQYAISKEEFEYWEDVRDIVNITGSPFDPPPGTVKGNVYNPDNPDERILGYFSVSGVSYRRHFTNAIELGVAAHPLCSQWPRPNECMNCLLIGNSTTTRPEYWEP